jgi:hypothetical protein
LTLSSFSPSVSSSVGAFIASLKNYYLNKFENATKGKDEKVSDLTKDSVSRANFLQLKDDYENESLSDLVTNRTTPYRILDLDGKYIQKIDPVYLDPVDSDLGRAHFFAPRKKVFGKYYSTYWVNIYVIWIMSLSLGITLYFDLLKKFINFLERVFNKFSPETR